MQLAKPAQSDVSTQPDKQVIQ